MVDTTPGKKPSGLQAAFGMSLIPSWELPVEYASSQERQFHVIRTAPLDTKEIPHNYDVLRHCLKSTKEEVHEAEMRLHRQPVSNDEASLERFRKMEMQRATEEFDLTKTLRQEGGVNHSWKTEDAKKKKAPARQRPGSSDGRGGGASVGPKKPTPIEGVTAERFYELRAHRRMAQPVEAVRHAKRALAYQQARSELEQKKNEEKVSKSQKVKFHKKVQPKEGKGLTTWWSGANPAHLGPGSYEGTSRSAIMVGELNDFSSSFRCEEPRSIDFRVVGGNGSLTSKHMPEHRISKWSMSKHLDQDSQAGLVVLEAQGKPQSVWSSYSAECTLGKESSLQRFKRPKQTHFGKGNRFHEKRSIQAILKDRKVKTREETDFTFGALDYEPPKPKEPISEEGGAGPQPDPTRQTHRMSLQGGRDVRQPKRTSGSFVAPSYSPSSNRAKADLMHSQSLDTRGFAHSPSMDSSQLDDAGRRMSMQDTRSSHGGFSRSEANLDLSGSRHVTGLGGAGLGGALAEARAVLNGNGGVLSGAEAESGGGSPMPSANSLRRINSNHSINSATSELKEEEPELLPYQEGETTTQFIRRWKRESCIYTPKAPETSVKREPEPKLWG